MTFARLATTAGVACQGGLISAMVQGTVWRNAPCEGPGCLCGLGEPAKIVVVVETPEDCSSGIAMARQSMNKLEDS